jgi:hypothetical protein
LEIIKLNEMNKAFPRQFIISTTQPLATVHGIKMCHAAAVHINGLELV